MTSASKATKGFFALFGEIRQRGIFLRFKSFPDEISDLQ